MPYKGYLRDHYPEAQARLDRGEPIPLGTEVQTLGVHFRGRVALVLLLLMPATASGATLSNPWFARADKVAAAYWKATPAQCAELTWATRPFDPAVVASAELGGCERQVARLTLRTVNYAQFCDAAVHEYGHLLGYNHAGETWPTPGPTPEQDPLGVMGLYGAEIPGCHASKPDGRTRTKRRSKDRRWCAKHAELCKTKYPSLASASLTL